MSQQQAHVHHYVPRWFQKRFLSVGQDRFCYLDLHPDVVKSKRVTYTRRALLNWGPAKCFYKPDLYTFKLGNFTTDEIEKRFFGQIEFSWSMRALSLIPGNTPT